MSKHYLFGVLVALLISSDGAFAQVPESPQVTEQDTQSQSSPEVIAENEETQNQDVDNTEPEDEDSPSRFIPTEQISQDLGVSFPADI